MYHKILIILFSFYCTLSYSVKYVEIYFFKFTFKKSLGKPSAEHILIWFTSFPSTVFGTNYFQLHAANYLIDFIGIGLGRCYNNWRMSLYQLTSSLNSSEKSQRSMCFKNCALPRDWHIMLMDFLSFCLFVFHSSGVSTWLFIHRASALTSPKEERRLHLYSSSLGAVVPKKILRRNNFTA